VAASESLNVWNCHHAVARGLGSLERGYAVCICVYVFVCVVCNIYDCAGRVWREVRGDIVKQI
jgi:hypothetical protein